MYKCKKKQIKILKEKNSLKNFKKYNLENSRKLRGLGQTNENSR